MLRWNRAQKKRKEFAEMEMPTGKTIQTLRRQKGLTQEQLAEAVGVTAAAVSKWETASAYPDILLLCPLARALGTTPDILLDFRPLLSEEELKAIWEKDASCLKAAAPKKPAPIVKIFCFPIQATPRSNSASHRCICAIWRP